MIRRLTGRLVAVETESVLVELGGVGYEVLVPLSALPELTRCIGQEQTLHTIQYFEGSPAAAHLVPRLVGFLTEADRGFFSLFTKIKGISIRRGLRAMSVPVPQLAAAIEHGDTRLLTGLPEIGKKTAAQIIAELRGRMGEFIGPSALPPAIADLTAAQRVAAEILVQWGDRRADAERWVAAAVAADPSLTEPDAIVRAAYRVKEGRM